MPVITISRGSLTGGRQLAEKLRQELKFPLISRDDIIESATQYGLPEAKMAEGMQSAPGLWDRLTHGTDRYVVAAQAALASRTARGDAIYHGVAGALLLRDLPGVLRVRLTAPLHVRVNNAVEQQGMSREEALRHIEESDEQRTHLVRQVYGAEWTDSTLYDTVVNLERVDMASAVGMVVDLLECESFCNTPERLQRFRDFAVESRIRAELLFHSEFSVDSIDIRVNRGEVSIEGGAHLEKNRASICAFIAGVEGVKRVLSENVDAVEATLESAQAPKLAADVMIPIDGYPNISESTTIRNAMVALGASSVRLPDGHLVPPRYLLVLDEMQRVVGVVARRNLIRGVAPQFQELEKSKAEVGQVLPFAQSAYSLASAWISLFTSHAANNATEPVRTVMGPIRGTVNVDDDLNVVVGEMLQHNVDLIPVVDGERAVGVVMMTEVFDIVAQFILENPTKPA